LLSSQVNRHTAWDDLPEWLSVEDVSQLMGVARWTVYEAIERGSREAVGREGPYVHRNHFHPDATTQQTSVAAPAAAKLTLVATPAKRLSPKARREMIRAIAKQVLDTRRWSASAKQNVVMPLRRHAGEPHYQS
jgi:hypothetical protein